MANKDEGTSKKRGLSAFKLSLVVIILLLIPTTLEQLSVHEDTVKQIGRVCVPDDCSSLSAAYG